MKKNLNVILVSLIFSLVLWVSISLSNDYYATIDVPVKIVNFPEGYSTGSNLPEKISVKLKGEGWKLVSVNLGAESDFTISAGYDSGSKSVNLYNFLSENQWLSSDIEIIDISPDTLSFFVERVNSKKVQILPNMDINFKPGYGLASEVVISPESTIVYGPVSVLNNLRTITTEKLNFDNLDEKVSKQIKLIDLSGMVYEDNSVTIDLDVQKIVDKNIDDIPVEIIDLPRDRDVVLMPNKVSVGVRGGIDLLGKLSRNDLKAYVLYRDVVLDTLGSIVPKVELPENVAILFLKPDRLRYIIKKF